MGLLWIFLGSLLGEPAEGLGWRVSGGKQIIMRRAAEKYNVPYRALKAIYKVESGSGRNCGVRINKNETLDVGCFQINSIHWNGECRIYKVYTFRGNALCAARLLAKHKKYADIDPYWVARYHSKTPSLKKMYFSKLKGDL